nr:MAG TPA: hypothetical protein [Bacteriophage sp.]
MQVIVTSKLISNLFKSIKIFWGSSNYICNSFSK